MNSHEAHDAPASCRAWICRPTFQDMHHLVMPRLAARAQLRRHAMKLKFWARGQAHGADLDCIRIPNEEGEERFVVTVTDGFGLADGFYVVFCEEPIPELDGPLDVLPVMRTVEPFSTATLEILRSHEVVARERLRRWIATRDL